MGILTPEIKEILATLPKTITRNGKFQSINIADETEQEAIPWPDDLDNAAFHGLAGDVIKIIMPHSEADPAAVLINFLVGFGNIIGKSAYFMADREHYTNLFAMLVGASSVGKKGTSWSHVKKTFALVDEDWTHRRILTGLSSGEGLIFAVRDPVEKLKTNPKTQESQIIVEDEGESDKRLLLIESEFGKALKVMQRDGNTLSATLRQIWDSDYLIQSLTKSSQTKSINSHISIVGHITKEELNSLMQEVELINGLGNRFLWCCCRKSKSLPFSEPISTSDLNWLSKEIGDAADFAKNMQSLGMTDAVRLAWPAIYEELEKPKAGILGAVLARGVPIVRRLAVIYALLNKSNIVDTEHLAAALAVWARSEQSAKYIFGQKPIDAEQAKIEVGIIEFLKSGEKTQTEISGYFLRKKSAKEINGALQSLSSKGKILHRQEKKEKSIRSVTYWRLI